MTPAEKQGSEQLLNLRDWLYRLDEDAVADGCRWRTEWGRQRRAVAGRIASKRGQLLDSSRRASSVITQPQAGSEKMSSSEHGNGYDDGVFEKIESEDATGRFLPQNTKSMSTLPITRWKFSTTR